MAKGMAISEHRQKGSHASQEAGGIQGWVCSPSSSFLGEGARVPSEGEALCHSCFLWTSPLKVSTSSTSTVGTKLPVLKPLEGTLKPHPNHSTSYCFAHIPPATSADTVQDIISQGREDVRRQRSLGAVLKACKQRPGISPLLPSVNPTSMIK